MTAPYDYDYAEARFGYVDGRIGACPCYLFPGAFEEIMRIAKMYGAATAWCLPPPEEDPAQPPGKLTC